MTLFQVRVRCSMGTVSYTHLALATQMQDEIDHPAQRGCARANGQTDQEQRQITALVHVAFAPMGVLADADLALL